MDQLALESVELDAKHDAEYVTPGLLTPLPSETDGRRASLELSEWLPALESSPSFLTKGAQSPTNVRLTNQYGFVGDVVGGYEFCNQQLHDRKDETGIMPSALPCTPTTPPAILANQSDPGWSWQSRPEDGVFLHGPLGINATYPEPYQSNLALGSHFPLGPSEIWSSSAVMSNASGGNFGSGIYGYPDPYTYSFEPQYDLHDSAAYYMRQQSRRDQSRAMPAQTLGIDFASSRGWSEMRSVSPSGEDYALTDDESDYHPSGHALSSRARSTRKDRRAPNLRRRPHSSTRVLRGATFDMQVEDLTVMPDGRPQVLPPREETNRCHLKLKDGKPCPRAFRRIEHLKRHYRTDMHSTERPFICCVPECPKAFSRNDNLQAHYDTHWSEAKAGRNSRLPFEELCRHIRNAHPAEIAAIKIKSLRKRRACGKVVEARK